jgi:deferrochelatase/peroxidase EfeB
MIAIQDEQLDLSLPFDDREIGPAQEQFLANLQANILKGHGRDHVALLFLEIVDIDKARDFVRNFQVSDALTQLRQTQAFKEALSNKPKWTGLNLDLLVVNRFRSD